MKAYSAMLQENMDEAALEIQKVYADVLPDSLKGIYSTVCNNTGVTGIEGDGDISGGDDDSGDGGSDDGSDGGYDDGGGYDDSGSDYDEGSDDGNTYDAGSDDTNTYDDGSSYDDNGEGYDDSYGGEY